jgi:hypothetical protein
MMPVVVEDPQIIPPPFGDFARENTKNDDGRLRDAAPKPANPPEMLRQIQMRLKLIREGCVVRSDRLSNQQVDSVSIHQQDRIRLNGVRVEPRRKSVTNSAQFVLKLYTLF